ncbi:MAG: hypothetical protein ACLFVU_00040 [Phycisphaerae bacterium]
MLAWTLFYNPVHVPQSMALWLMIPLLIGLGIVYKTVRTRNLRRLPLEIALLILYMGGGLFALGLGLWIVQEYIIW